MTSFMKPHSIGPTWKHIVVGLFWALISFMLMFSCHTFDLDDRVRQLEESGALKQEFLLGYDTIITADGDTLLIKRAVVTPNRS